MICSNLYQIKLFRKFLFLIGWILKKSSPLKMLGQMNRNLVGSIYGRSFIRIAHFVPIHQAVSEKKIFLNWPIRNKNYLWRPCLLMDWNKMCNPNKGPSIDASYQVTVHSLPKSIWAFAITWRPLSVVR
jgi:hypothetical protein